MITHTEQLHVQTQGRSIIDITGQLRETVGRSEIRDGVVHLFVHHTSASLIVSENADPDVLTDLEMYFSQLVPDGDPRYLHTDEGPDDMPSHVRSALTLTSLTVPVDGGEVGLGTWQGVYLWEHRHAPHRRRVSFTVQGSP
jgi:secondary thiamine-phosphate synthase enzyme